MIKLTDVKSTAKTNQNVRVLVGFYSLMRCGDGLLLVEVAETNWERENFNLAHILEVRCGESITNLTRLN